ncbi:GerMN domain-containing protein [Jeotgalibaca sp. A127]|uniref:GerMN domain-containing protein n=1 Tax=Jeotgalibaca sp. A127 TaxID=3457324 RepID=UPI003FD2D40A
MEKKHLLSLVIVGLFVTGCRPTGTDVESSDSVISSESQVESSSQSSSEVESSESSESSEPANETASIAAYFPFEENVAYSFVGMGNEFATYTKYPQYLENNRIQYVTNNGGTETVEVLEYADGTLTQVFQRPETYFRENMLNKTSDDAGTILLKEPLALGTAWDNPSGSASEITAMSLSIETMLGTFPAIEVTTTDDDTITKQYYVEGMGLVKELFTDNAGSYEVSSTLETRNEDAPEAKVILTFYPDANVMGLESSEVNVAFNTNDVTRHTLTDLFRQIPGVEYGRLIPDSATINSLYLNDDGRVYIDFNNALITDMNTGSSGESLILQGIVNTIGTYYGVEEVVLTVENEPYESGHFSFEEGEAMRVDMEDVIK